MRTFPELFRKYRLKAEFETFTEFSEALAEKGFYYEESIFSRWQNGKRKPNNRQLILTILEIFIERGAIKRIDEANEILESLNQGFLTRNEIEKLPPLGDTSVVFQVPHEIADFTGREDLLKVIKKATLQGKVIHIYGSAGVGKTSLAIKIAHLLRSDFPDGILWYRIGNISLKELFTSIAYVFNQQLPASKNIEFLASFIRSLLSRKKILFILDDVEIKNHIHLLLPINSTVIIISRQKNIYIPADVIPLSLQSFSQQEALSLFQSVLNKNYVKKYQKELLAISKSVGNLPLAVHIFAKQLQQSKILPKTLYASIQREVSLHNLSYENKDLYLAINISYKNLSKKARAVFLSFGVFEGEDFSVEAIAYMNGITIEKTRIILDELQNVSLIETSLNNKFRIHPMIKRFIAEKFNSPYKSLFNKIVFFTFMFFSLYWIYLQATNITDDFSTRMFSSTYFIVALSGALLGVHFSQKWGLKSIMGKAILFFALGLFAQVIGQVSYAYYAIFLKVAIPYPSIGDIGYFGTFPIYIMGVFFLAKISGVKIGLALLKNHLTASILSISVLIVCLVLLLQHYIFIWSNPLKIFLDLVAPIGDWIYVFLAILIYLELKREKRDIMKNKIILLPIALFMQFLSDYVFIYQANLNIWKNGQINDYMYFVAYLLMTLGIITLNSHFSKKIKSLKPSSI